MLKHLNECRHFLRVTGFAVIFVLCTAFECYQTSTDIQYAQGYGYVVGITCTYNCKTANTSTAFYLSFDTYEQAKAWLDRWNQGERSNFANGTTRTIGNNTGEYDKIAGLLRPVPIPFTPSDSLELNQPQPYVPQ
ncbi:hypothetical protein [Dongia sedimenti]|uniref:Uncharacterized protein n=1 Tax=Dongia sedimenti TaxID=3064282 RepID=A0ABU0YV67_9PROT|nr:hypothetical protein [Rhodospirillaceae bacterium R-7]